MKKIRHLSEKNLLRRKLALNAIEDYYGGKIDEEKFKRLHAAIKTGNTSGLNDEEQSDVWRIRRNLEDGVYIRDLAT